jgi:glycosyltransferase involved in cell wall biosynthesis
MSFETPLVSVIVPTYNSEEYLKDCLFSIREQSYENIELIVVDNYSKDFTYKIAAQYTKKVFTSGPERCSQRNYGFRQSVGVFVVFIDSDMILSPNVISEAIDKCINSGNSYDGIYLPEISIGTGFWASCKALEKSCYIGDDTIEAARFFRRDVFQNVGGYDEGLVSAEDWDLSQKVVSTGSKLGRINAVIKHNEGHLRLWQTMKKKYYYGQKIHFYIKRNPNKSLIQLIPLRAAFLRNWRNLVKNPIICAGFIFMKFCEFGAGWSGGMKAAIEYLFKMNHGVPK